MELREIARDVYACLQPDRGWGWSNAGLVKAGTVEIPAIEPRTEAKIATTGVDMTRITRLPLSEGKGGT